MLELSIRNSSLLVRHVEAIDGKAVIIDRDTCGKADVVDAFSTDIQARLQAEVFVEKMILYAAFGTYISPSKGRYFVVCTEADASAFIAPVRGEQAENEGQIFRLRRAELVPYVSATLQEIDESEMKLIASLERLLSSGTFYFSKVGDDIGRAGLLSRCQERGGADRDLADCGFLWNKQLIEELADSLVSSVIISPLMQGFAQTKSIVTEDNTQHSVTVISRRSVKQAGTRYNARGIDDEGCVAIFAETECIVTSSSNLDFEIFSFVQVRGSVPVFWSQTNPSTGIELTRNADMTKQAFRRHLNWLSERYNLHKNGSAVFVNLLSASKGGESVLSAALSTQVSSLENDQFGENGVPIYVEFDFHRFVNSSQPLEESLTPLMDTLRPFIYHFKYFGCSSESEFLQEGLFRVNCLDCLDRTNAVQMQIAWESLMLAKLRIAPKSSVRFKSIFTDVWVKNGDVISKGYSGTGSVLSRLVRTAGKGGSTSQIATMLEHSWRSANRFIAANWDDATRQKAISHLLDSSNNSSYAVASMNSPRRVNLSVWVGTWNLNGNRMDTDLLFGSWLMEAPDIVVLGCQETIDLTTVNVLLATRGDDERNRAIDMKLVDRLSQIDPLTCYVQVACESLVGLYISVFVREHLGHQIDRIKTNRFKAGFGGTTGNKGSVSVSFRVEKSVEIECFNLHLDSGEFRNDERMNQLTDILDNSDLLNFSSSQTNKAVFLCGDFNFRCDGIDSQLAREYIWNNRLEKLRIFDPYVSSSSNILKAVKFREMPLLFFPTYKYDPSGKFSEKRIPSWCDRVFYRLHADSEFELIPQMYFSDGSVNFSDHKPVAALFRLSNKRPPLVTNDLLSGEKDSPPDLLS